VLGSYRSSLRTKAFLLAGDRIGGSGHEEATALASSYVRGTACRPR
jgi:hypothetical protein